MSSQPPVSYPNEQQQSDAVFSRSGDPLVTLLSDCENRGVLWLLRMLPCRRQSQMLYVKQMNWKLLVH